MIDPTLSRSLLVLAATLSPGELIRVASLASGAAGSGDPAAAVRVARLRRYGLPAAHLLVGGLAIYLTPQAVFWRWPGGHLAWWLAAAVVAAALAQLGEIGLGYGWLRARGAEVRGVRLHRAWDDPTVVLLLSTGLVGAAEELIFRGVWLELLSTTHGWPALAAVGLSTLVYGLNHWFLGPLVVAQKLLSGAVYGSLFLLSGHAVVVPLVAHVAQNILVVSLARPEASDAESRPTGTEPSRAAGETIGVGR